MIVPSGDAFCLSSSYLGISHVCRRRKDALGRAIGRVRCLFVVHSVFAVPGDDSLEGVGSRDRPRDKQTLV